MQYKLDIEYLSDIPRVANISYEEFVERFLSKNLPCLLDEVQTRSWKSRQEWTLKGKPCFEFLKKTFGEAIVPVAECDKVEFQSHPKKSMLLKDYIDYWESCADQESKLSKNDTICWYLKDWHFWKSFPDYKAYHVPVFFQSDWLNEFWDKWSEMKDDYRFVYMGPKGSWTPFHADVFRSHSWSANVCGLKKWILYPPGSEQYLRDTHGNLMFDVTSSETNDRKRFPDFERAPKPLVVEQKEGEVIFVPSCWHHQVINEEDTISINHNWINGSGILQSWQHLKDELQLVKHSINDCRNMDGWANQCQIILAANSGMNYAVFFKFLCVISCPRALYLRTLVPNSSILQDKLLHSHLPLPLKENFPFDAQVCVDSEALILTAKQNMFHTKTLCLYDLQKIKEVLRDFTLDEDVEEMLKGQAVSLLSYLTEIIDVSLSCQS